jgi:hypothetical protein
MINRGNDLYSPKQSYVNVTGNDVREIERNLARYHQLLDSKFQRQLLGFRDRRVQWVQWQTSFKSQRDTELQMKWQW